MKLACRLMLSTPSWLIGQKASKSGYIIKTHRHFSPVVVSSASAGSTNLVQLRKQSESTITSRDLHFTMATMSEQDLKALENMTLTDGAVQNGTTVRQQVDGRERVKSVSEQSKEDAPPAILRYQADAGQYQLTCSIHRKTFNFTRSTSEPISSLYDRLIKNVSKKVKHFEENVKLRLGDNVLDPSDSMLAILEKFDWQNITDTNLTLQIDNEVLRVQLNPPEVYKIKFFKSGMVGFPVAPVKLEGSPNFNPKLSKYEWEYAPLSSRQLEEVRAGKKLSATRKNSWSDCCSTGSEVSESLVLIPDESLLGTRLRFTCTPTSDGKTFGQPLYEETPFVLTAPPTNNFVFNERLKRIDYKPAVEVSPGFLRVITYNTLADTYATKEWFSSSPEDSLSSEYRLPIVNHELKMYQGDLICLQEVDDKYYERFYEPFLSHCGLNGYFSCKTDSTKEGIAVFHNPQRLTATELLTVPIADHMKTLDFYKNTILKHPTIVERLDERNTVLQVAVFDSVLKPDTMLLVANTHLFFHPDADHIRLLQTLTSLNFIEAKLRNLKSLYPNKNIHVLFCGDFNCTPPFSSFRAITTGQIEDYDFDWTSHETEKMEPGVCFSHNLNLINSHPDHELTNIVRNFEGCLDYIFYQPSMKLLKTYPPPSKATIAEICGTEESKVSLPNFHAPSDHVPLIVDFSL